MTPDGLETKRSWSWCRIVIIAMCASCAIKRKARSRGEPTQAASPAGSCQTSRASSAEQRHMVLVIAAAEVISRKDGACADGADVGYIDRSV